MCTLHRQAVAQWEANGRLRMQQERQQKKQKRRQYQQQLKKLQQSLQVSFRLALPRAWSHMLGVFLCSNTTTLLLFETAGESESSCSCWKARTK